MRIEEDIYMLYRQIQKTDMKVSEMCLGTMTFGSPVNEEDSIKLIYHAMEMGVNFFDTANMYEGYNRTIGSPGGVAESILGKALKGRRHNVIVATKVGMKVGNAPEDEYTSPAALKKHIDLSLERLDIDVIDIYYLHKPDPETPLEEILGALADIIKAGKIRYYGISNYSGRQLKALLDVADSAGLPRPVISQPPLSLLDTEALDEHIPLCVKESIAVAPYRVIQSGLLTGKYKRNEKIHEYYRFHEKPQWMIQITDEVFDKLEEIEKCAKVENLTMMQYAIKWILKKEGIVSAILGVKNLTQLDEITGAI